MIKKLDILIIRAFVGPFFATFLIATFVLVMQFFWLYIDDLVGKGLDLIVILKLAGLAATFYVPMSLPLALLLSSIMTFGNMGEKFELVAIKAAGIPLVRFMRPLFLITCLLSVVAFSFTNNIIPVVNLKLNALKYNIIVKKPALNIKEGVFYDKIEGFAIKIGSKEKNDSVIHNIVIYERNLYGLQDRMMVAESGIMSVTPDNRFLQFKLYNGWRYEENGRRLSKNTEFIRLGYKEYQKMFDLSSFKMPGADDSLFQYDPKMLSVRQLHESIDSLKSRDTYYKRSKRDFNSYFNFARLADSNWSTIKKLPLSRNLVLQTPLQRENTTRDVQYTWKQYDPFDMVIGETMIHQINQRALNQASGIQGNTIGLYASEYSNKQMVLRKHWIEWNRKFALPVACIVLFMIGAPLGSIIRKGGLGAPLVFAVIFFTLFYFINNIGEKSAREGVLSPAMGMWLSTLILTPIGIFLTIKAMRDSNLFSKEFYYRFIKSIKRIWKKNQKKVEPPKTDEPVME